MAHVSIAAATEEDMQQVASVHVKSWQQTYVGLVPQAYLDTLNVAARLPGWRQHFEKNRADDFFGLFLARVDGTAAGFISFGTGRDDDRRELPEINSIYVLKEYWGKGIGYGLYLKSHWALRQKNCSRAYLWVLDTNLMAIAAYQRWGGVVEDRRKDHIIGGQPVTELSVLFNLSISSV